MIESLNSGVGEALKLLSVNGIKLDKIGDFAKEKGLDGNFADKLGNILKKYDKNSDNRLSFGELKDATGELKEKIGLGNAGLTVEQLNTFKNAAANKGIETTPILDGIISGFNSFDSNSNGKLSAKELRSAINSYKQLV